SSAGALRVQRETARSRGLERQILQSAARILRGADEQALQQVYFEGLSHMLSQPEFASSQKALPIVETLERGYVLARLLAHADADEEVGVVIGQENPLEQMRDQLGDDSLRAHRRRLRRARSAGADSPALLARRAAGPLLSRPAAHDDQRNAGLAGP